MTTQDTTPTPILDRIRQSIRDFGWHVVASHGGKQNLQYVYTVGFCETLNHPEVVISGLDPEATHRILNALGYHIRHGTTFSEGTSYPGIHPGLDCAFRVVSPRHQGDLFQPLYRYYGDRDFELLQAVWSDMWLRYPWQDGFDPAIPDKQELFFDL